MSQSRLLLTLSAAMIALSGTDCLAVKPVGAVGEVAPELRTGTVQRLDQRGRTVVIDGVALPIASDVKITTIWQGSRVQYQLSRDAQGKPIVTAIRPAENKQ